MFSTWGSEKGSLPRPSAYKPNRNVCDFQAIGQNSPNQFTTILHLVRELSTRNTLLIPEPNTPTLKLTHNACKTARETHYKSHMQLFFIHYIPSAVLFTKCTKYTVRVNNQVSLYIAPVHRLTFLNPLPEPLIRPFRCYLRNWTWKVKGVCDIKRDVTGLCLLVVHYPLWCIGGRICRRSNPLQQRSKKQRIASALMLERGGRRNGPPTSVPKCPELTFAVPIGIVDRA